MDNVDKKDEIDWSVLKSSITFLCISLILSSALIGSSYYFKNKSGKEFNRNKGIFQSVSRQYLNVDREEQLLRDYYPKFVKLYNHGVIGREKRLDWIEVLRWSVEKVNLPSFNYTIRSQEEFAPEFNINYSGYKLFNSRMELNLGLLHEIDFFKLLDLLNRNAEGLFTVSECTFKMNGREIKFDKNHANIFASCSLNWITINTYEGIKVS